MKNNHARRISLLVRSLFPICFLMLISGLSISPIIFSHKSDYNQLLFSQWSIHWLIIICAFVIILGCLTFICKWLLYYDKNDLQIKIASIIHFPYDNFICSIIFLGTILAFFGALYLWNLNTNNATNVLVGLFLFWFFLIWILITSLYWPELKRILKLTQPWFVGIGVSVVLILCMELYLRGYDYVFDDANVLVDGDVIDERFLGEENIAWQSAYWKEFNGIEAQWTPYVYWRRKPFSGEFININQRGVRYTILPSDSTDMEIFFFGGSTMWGTGARDNHTIPSEFVTILAQNDVNVKAINFGESGYISQQDNILFQFQLQQDNIPDIAIFYWGYNDILSIWGSNHIGLPLNESNRVAEFQFGRDTQWELPNNTALITLLYNTSLGARLLSKLGIEEIQLDNTVVDISVMGGLENANLLLTSYPGNEADDIIEYLVNIMAQIEYLAKLNNIEVVFVWQPVPYLKEPLCSHEKAYIEEFPGRFKLSTLFLDVDAKLRKLAQGNDSNLFVISDLFKDHEECVFIDEIHITEEGNRMVAEQLIQHLAILKD